MLTLEQVEALVMRLQQGGLLYPAASKEASKARLEIWSATLNADNPTEEEATRAMLAYTELPSDAKPKNFGPGDLLQTIRYERNRAPKPSPWLTEGDQEPDKRLPQSGRWKPLWDSPEQAQLAQAVVREHPFVRVGRPSDGTLLHHIHKLAVLAGLMPRTTESIADGVYRCGTENCGECR